MRKWGVGGISYLEYFFFQSTILPVGTRKWKDKAGLYSKKKVISDVRANRIYGTTGGEILHINLSEEYFFEWKDLINLLDLSQGSVVIVFGEFKSIEWSVSKTCWHI